MKLTKNQLTVAICSVAILLISLTVLLLDVFVPLNFWTHPALNFLFVLFLGYGITALVVGSWVKVSNKLQGLEKK